MTKYISGRVKDLKVGLNAYSEDKVSLDVVGIVSVKNALKVGAGITMDAASGIITATSFKGSSGVDATFVGDGSGLSGVVGSGAGVVIRDDNNLVGTAGTINFGTNLNVTAISVGVVTVTASIDATDNATNLVGGFARASELDVSGISTFVGLSTFNNGLIVHAGVSTFNDDIKGDFTTNISGISSVTALTFYGNGQYLTGTQATGNATLGDLKVSGISTFVGLSTFNNGLIVHAGVTTVSDSLEVGLGITAHAGVITATKFDGNAAGLIGSPNIIVGTIVGASLSVTGIATITDVWGQSATLKIGTGITANGGIITATTFDGALDGNATTATNASGLSGTPDINVRNLVAVEATFSGISTFTDNVTVGSAITIGAISGIITAASYRGDGSLLSGITASGTGVQIKDSGTPVGAAGTINFGKNLIVGEIVDSVATVTGIGTEFIKAESLNVSGISTFVGLSTFNNGLIVHAGVSTFHGEIHALSNVGIGTTNPQADLQVGTGVTVYGNSGIVSATTYYGSGANLTDIDTTQIQTGNTSVQTIDTGSDGHVKVTTEGTERFRITSNGDVGIGTDNPTGVNAVGTGNTAVLAVGIITASQINASGITSASAFANFDYLQAPYGSTTTFTVTVASKDATHRYNGTGSGNGYLINGVQAPILTLTPGRTYRFTNDNTGSHPLKFYYEADKTTLYTTGVSFQNTYTEITVSDTTPNVLHYQCTAHVKMGNAVITNSNVVDTPYTLKVGTGITASAGIITATTFKGALDGNATSADTATSASGLTNNPSIDVSNIVGTALSISGISSVGAAITMYGATGIVSATSFSGSGANLTGLTGASAATYGDGSNVAAITVNSDGKITGISEVTISGGGGSSGVWETNATGINTSTNVGIGTTTASDATLTVDVGTASTAVVVQGSEGQLFSVTNSLSSGSIFSVNDISGIPSIDVDADGTIQLAPYGSTENVGVGTTNPTSKLHVVGGANITGVLTTGHIADSNGTVGAASSVLSSTGSGLSWVAQSGGGGGISLSDLSVTSNSAGTAALGYDNSTGVFSYTPPDLSGYQASLTFGISNTNAVKIDDASAANGEYVQLTASGIVGVSTETLGDAVSGSLTNIVGTALSISGGISTLGVTSATDLEAQQLYVTGISSVGAAITMYGATGIVSATNFYGQLNDLTFPTADGTDGYVLTSNGSGIVQWEAAPGAGGGISGITVQEEGSDLTTLATTLNFVGASVEATGGGATKTITITGGSGGASTGKAIAMAMIFG